jgi:thiamine phosphate synthase YjbQ (UPF0047 family)
MLGGITPKSMFAKLFKYEGFIQNAWYRYVIGSASPTLEISQIYRGLLEATENLNFSLKNLLKIWSFRNLNRLNKNQFPPLLSPGLFHPLKKVSEIGTIETQNEIIIEYKIRLRSHSITQLLFLTDLVKEIKEKANSKYPNLRNGDLFLRSYHTTTTLIINEQEQGNFLDLHFKFAELSRKDSSSFLHTVSAQENRADFNHYDHLVATKYGSRELTLPIVNKQLEIGGRENFYLLVTFGPRNVSIFIKIRLLKE